MRDYEVVYIFAPALDEDAVNEKLERFHEPLTADSGEITAVDHWGARQLAYPIGPVKSGYYTVAQFRADAEALPTFERLLKLDEDVIRYLIVLNEGEPTSGISVMVSRPSRINAEEGETDEEEEKKEEAEEEESEVDPRSAPPEFSGGRGSRRRVESPPIEVLNYKDVTTLSRFITEQGKLLPKRTTKVTAAFQRKLSKAVKRGRYLALLPYVRDHEA